MSARVWVFVLVTVLPLPVLAQGHTQEGAVLGGVAGAIAGGIIGHQNDETPEGAIIGGVLGAVTGGMIGNAKDEQLARERQHLYYQQQWAARAVSMSDVVSMSRNGLSDSVIINQIRTNGVQRELTTHDIISLHQQGVRESVITAMQDAAVGKVRVVESVPSSRPAVVVRREYHVVPRYAPRRHVHVYRYQPHRHYWRQW